MTRYIFVLVAILSVACAGKLDWRVIGGSQAEDGQFPYQVSIREYDYHVCGGSIINEQWILTAAHCVYGSSPAYLKVVVGTNKLNEGGVIHKVARAIPHKEYGRFSLKNDIALVQIDGSIAFNDKAQPIPLETSDIAAGEDIILTGWGQTSSGDTPQDLQFVSLTSITSEECRKRHVDSGHDVTSLQLCTETKGYKGACYGDSGGPLAHSGKLAGIVSWGRPCAEGYPDVNTRVSSYIDWIKENTQS